jgi:hypothetical protein
MAFHADFHLALAVEAGWIHDRPANGILIGRFRFCRGDVSGAGSVAALTIDSRGEVVGENRFPACLDLFRQCRRVGIVAKDTTPRDDPKLGGRFDAERVGCFVTLAEGSVALSTKSRRGFARLA